MPFLFFIILLVGGLIHILSPRTAWYMSIGWKLQDAEPSDGYLIMTRIGGVLMLVGAVIALIVGFS